MKSKSIFPKSLVRKIKRVFRKYPDPYDNGYKIDQRLIADLYKIGFRKYKKSDFGSSNTFLLSYKNKYIIKDCGLSHRKPKKSVPTLFINRYYSVLLQPVVDTKSRKARKAINEFRCWNDGKYGIDCHRGNIGLYKGELAVFDW